MYDYYYNTLKRKYGDNVRLLYTDTDSFIIKIDTEDFYQDMRSDNDFLDSFDLSDYPSNHALFDGLSPETTQNLQQKNKKVLGKFKDEGKGVLCKEAFIIRAKCYHLVYEHNTTKTTAKGVKKAIRNQIKTDAFRRTIFNDLNKDNMITKEYMSSIRSYENQTVFNTRQHKTVMSALDEKRYNCEDGINLLSYGHYKLRK